MSYHLPHLGAQVIKNELGELFCAKVLHLQKPIGCKHRHVSQQSIQSVDEIKHALSCISDDVGNVELISLCPSAAVCSSCALQQKVRQSLVQYDIK